MREPLGPQKTDEAKLFPDPARAPNEELPYLYRKEERLENSWLSANGVPAHGDIATAVGDFAFAVFAVFDEAAS
jgi:hypothetical protein